jgi:hypothetical protein
MMELEITRLKQFKLKLTLISPPIRADLGLEGNKGFATVAVLVFLPETGLAPTFFGASLVAAAFGGFVEQTNS